MLTLGFTNFLTMILISRIAGRNILTIGPIELQNEWFITYVGSLCERVISGALKNGVIDEEEFNILQTLHLETLNELTGVDRRMESENRSLVEKSLMEEINEIKKIKEQAFNCLLDVLFSMLL